VNPWDGVYMDVLDYQWGVAAGFWTEIDALAREQRARQPLRLTRRLAQRGTRSRVGAGREADVARGRARRRRERPARAGTGEREEGEDERGAFVIHAAP